jgi:hypothetical protein
MFSNACQWQGKHSILLVQVFFLCVCVLLGFDLRAYTLSHSISPIFCDGFFEIGSHELFAQVGFKL